MGFSEIILPLEVKAHENIPSSEVMLEPKF